MKNLTKAGRCIFAFCIMAFGAQQLFFGEFLTIFIPSWPAWIPWHKFWTYFFGVYLIVTGLSIMLNLRGRLAALLFAGVSLLLLVFLQLPFQIKNSTHSLLEWADAFTILAIAGCALIISGGGFAAQSSRAGSAGWVLLGRICFSIMLIIFGFEHFLYPRFIVQLVPAWIPGHLFWTYFAGTALMVSGLAIMSGVGLRRISMLLGIMLFFWVILLHIPRAIADPISGLGGEWSSVFQALGFSGVSFVLAGRNAKVR